MLKCGEDVYCERYAAYDLALQKRSKTRKVLLWGFAAMKTAETRGVG